MHDGFVSSKNAVNSHTIDVSDVLELSGSWATPDGPQFVRAHPYPSPFPSVFDGDKK